MPKKDVSLPEPSKETKRSAFSAERGRYIYNGDRVFLGSIDDSVSRNPWEDLDPSLRYLNTKLVDSVLFGSPVAMRIGNILYQDEYLEALINPTSSQLLELAKVGFVQLQMKRDSINGAIAARVEAKTQSALDFKHKHYWYHGSDSYEALGRIDRELTGGVGKLRYSGQFNRYFRAIMKESAEGGTAAYRRVYEDWSRRPAEGEHSRTRDWFEKDARRIFDSNYKAILEAMWVANAANHYAYSLQFIDNTGGSEGLPMVETTQFDRHAEVCSRRQALPTELAEELLAKSALTDPINVALSVINVPAQAYDVSNAPVLAMLARKSPPSTDVTFDESLWHDFRTAKTDLVTGINRYLGNPAQGNVTEVRERAAFYNSVLHRAFGAPSKKQFRTLVRFLTRKENALAAAENIGTNSLTLGAGSVNPLAGLALGVALFAVPLRHIAKSVDLKRFKGQADHPVDILFDDDAPDKAKKILADSAHRRYGTYVGVRTLDRDKALQFRAGLTDHD